MYLGTKLTNRNEVHNSRRRRINSGNVCFHSIGKLLSSRLLPEIPKIRKTLPVIL